MNREKAKQAEDVLSRGGIVVLPTDTIYGIVGLALKPRTVSRISALRKRNTRKPMIVLIGSVSQLKLFNVTVSSEEKQVLRRVWPGKVSVVLRCQHKKYSYLHRGTRTIAFRFPKRKSLTRLLKAVGPVVAPSANTEGDSPAATIKKAREYFGDKVALYVPAGRLVSLPSTVIQIDNREMRVLRRGAVPVERLYRNRR